MKVVLVGVNATFNHTNLAIKSIKKYCQKAINDKNADNDKNVDNCINADYDKNVDDGINVDNNNTCKTDNDNVNDFDIICLEFTINDSVRENVAVLLNENAAVYGFSCYIWNIIHILEITEILKKINPRCVIILGGPEVSFEDNDFFCNHMEVDYLIQGPGEKAFLI